MTTKAKLVVEDPGRTTSEKVRDAAVVAAPLVGGAVLANEARKTAGRLRKRWDAAAPRLLNTAGDIVDDSKKIAEQAAEVGKKMRVARQPLEDAGGRMKVLEKSAKQIPDAFRKGMETGMQKEEPTTMRKLGRLAVKTGAAKQVEEVVDAVKKTPGAWKDGVEAGKKSKKIHPALRAMARAFARKGIYFSEGQGEERVILHRRSRPVRDAAIAGTTVAGTIGLTILGKKLLKKAEAKGSKFIRERVEGEWLDGVRSTRKVLRETQDALRGADDALHPTYRAMEPYGKVRNRFITVRRTMKENKALPKELQVSNADAIKQGMRRHGRAEKWAKLKPYELRARAKVTQFAAPGEEAYRDVRRTIRRGREVGRAATRGYRLTRDLAEVAKGQGRGRDRAGRPRLREWEKDWFKAAAATAAGTALVVGGPKAYRLAKQKGIKLPNLPESIERWVDGAKKQTPKTKPADLRVLAERNTMRKPLDAGGRKRGSLDLRGADRLSRAAELRKKRAWASKPFGARYTEAPEQVRKEAFDLLEKTQPTKGKVTSSERKLRQEGRQRLAQLRQEHKFAAEDPTRIDLIDPDGRRVGRAADVRGNSFRIYTAGAKERRNRRRKRPEERIENEREQHRRDKVAAGAIGTASGLAVATGVGILAHKLRVAKVKEGLGRQIDTVRREGIKAASRARQEGIEVAAKDLAHWKERARKAEAAKSATSRLENKTRRKRQIEQGPVVVPKTGTDS